MNALAAPAVAYATQREFVITADFLERARFDTIICENTRTAIALSRNFFRLLLGFVELLYEPVART